MGAPHETRSYVNSVRSRLKWALEPVTRQLRLNISRDGSQVQETWFQTGFSAQMNAAMCYEEPLRPTRKAGCVGMEIEVAAKGNWMPSPRWFMLLRMHTA
jgi:hypothetical protein